mgnify:CR=1 FL=1
MTMNGKSGNTNYVYQLTMEQAELLKEVLQERNFEISEAPYCNFKASGNKVSIAMYLSGKLVIQGRGADEFIEFTLEPSVLKADSFLSQNMSISPSPAYQGTMLSFEPHAGTDESGKGDFFGPLVIASVFVDSKEAASALSALGVKDSKKVSGDKAILSLARQIVPLIHGKYGMTVIGPEAYNRLYDRIGNLNKLLAWGHARAMENMLNKAPECTRAISDQFAAEHFIQDALLSGGKKIELIQRTKAESDIAVAAASILARAEFVKRMESLGQIAGITLPRGAGPQVDEAARSLAQTGGAELLSKFAKMHFSTAAKALKEI